MEKGIIYDVRLFSAEEKLRRNILGVRAAVTQTEGYIDQQSFSLVQGQTLTVQNLPFNSAFMMHSSLPVNVSATVPGNVGTILFPPQSIFLLTCGMNDVEITNNNSGRSTIMITRLSRTSVQYLEPLKLLTVAAFQNIIPLGFSVTDSTKFGVLKATFEPLTNNQVVAPGVGATDLYRICDVDGTPNLNGAYIMYLDSAVTDSNASGTLQLWVSELA